MAFTYDLTTDAGQVRFLLSDHREEGAAFSDAEVTDALTRAGSIEAACARLIRVLLADRSRRARVYAGSVTDGATYDDTAQVAALRDMLDVYGGGSIRLPTVTIGTMGAHPSDPTSTG